MLSCCWEGRRNKHISISSFLSSSNSPQFLLNYLGVKFTDIYGLFGNAIAGWLNSVPKWIILPPSFRSGPVHSGFFLSSHPGPVGFSRSYQNGFPFCFAAFLHEQPKQKEKAWELSFPSHCVESVPVFSYWMLPRRCVRPDREFLLAVCLFFCSDARGLFIHKV